MAKICFLIYDFTKMGGAERASAKLMSELVKSHTVSMISIFNKYDDFGYALDSRINTSRIINSEASISKTIATTTNFVRKHIKKEKCEYLLSIDVATAPIGVLGTFMTKAKLIMCDRSSVYNEDMYSKINLRLYGWLGIHACDIYQVMTEAGKKGCLERYHVSSNKVKVIPNWIDEMAIKDCSYSHENRKIITVGRATPEKNYEGLIDIAEIIKPYAKGWEWHIWGNFENEYGQKLLDEIKRRKLDNFLIHRGITKNIYDEYGKYCMYVMTSKFEGMPNVILEARGSKLPVIAYNCKTGPSELIVDGENGFLIPMNNTEMMAEKIKLLIDNKKIAQRMSEKWNLEIERYYKSNVIKKWERLFE